MLANVPEGFADGSKQLQIFIRKATIQANSRLAPFEEGTCVIEVKNIGKVEISLSAYASRDSDLLEWMESSDFSPYHKSADGTWKPGTAAAGSYPAHDRKFSLDAGARKEIALRFAVDSSQAQRSFRIDFFVSVVGQKRKLFLRSEEFRFGRGN